MGKPPSAYPYRGLRLHNLFTKPYRHILLLLYWPVYGFVFWYVEQIHSADFYYPMHCVLDDWIPFCELFVIPYLYWFVFLIGMLVYTFFFDVPVFRSMMKFVIFAYSMALMIFLLFPNCQLLRPEGFPRDNCLTRFMERFYRFDTNTNVCPSIHVLGSAAALFAAWRTKTMERLPWKIGNFLIALLISLSTVFLKQHSVLDILAAIFISLPGYLLFFRPTKKQTP